MDKWEVERFTRCGREFVVYHAYDNFPRVPWEDCDGHGPVREALREDKRPGELILGPTGTRDYWHLYDFAGAVKLARKDGWDAPPYKTGTQGERAARAARSDYEYLQGWCNNEWHYIGVIVEHGGKDASLWGIESCATDYLAEVARDLSNEIRRELLAERKAAQAAARTALLARAFL